MPVLLALSLFFSLSRYLSLSPLFFPPAKEIAGDMIQRGNCPAWIKSTSRVYQEAYQELIKSLSINCNNEKNEEFFFCCLVMSTLWITSYVDTPRFQYVKAI
jgi:hypothetical protein